MELTQLQNVGLAATTRQLKMTKRRGQARKSKQGAMFPIYLYI